MQVLGVGIMYIMLGCTLYILPRYIDMKSTRDSLRIGKVLFWGGVITTLSSLVSMFGLIPELAAYITMACSAGAAALIALQVGRNIGKEISS